MAICLLGINALGQDLTKGTLKGTLADTSGAVIPGATVTVKSESTGFTTTVTSDNDGNYQVHDLLPGPYTITAEKQGYKKSVRTGQNISAANVTSVPIALEPGSIAETVTVTANAEETLSTDSAQVSGTLGTRKVEELPANGAGGGIDTLALLVPGVVPIRNGLTNTNGVGLSVNGNRGRSNNFQIDGADNNDLSVAGPALFVDFQDAVQEFQVITSNYSAQYGRNQGAIINIVTKGGGNQFHGSGFVHHQDWAHLSSLNNIERASGQTRPNQNLYTVYGGTFGGPLPFPRFGEVDPKDSYFRSGKNKAFFYVSYQEIRNPTVSTFFSNNFGILANQFTNLQTAFPTSPVVDAIVKNSVFAIPGSVIRTQSISGTPQSAQIRQSCAPNNTGPIVVAVGTATNPNCVYTTPINSATGQPFLFGGPYDIVNLPSATGVNQYFQAAQYQRNVNTSYNERDYSIRFDVKPTSRDTGTFRLIHQSSRSFGGITDTVGNKGDVPASSYNYGGNWTHNITSHVVNDFRAYYQRIVVDFGQSSCDQASDLSCVGSASQLANAYTRITFSAGAFGLTKTANSLASIGPATNLPQGRVEGVTQVIDNLTWITGSHTITVGGEFKHLTTNSQFLPNINGSFNFSSTTRFRNDTPNAASLVFGPPEVDFPENDKYAFFQDDFKVRPNLTLNLGLRYENTGQPINILNDITTERENNPATRFYDPSLPLSLRTTPRVPVDNDNWAPRVGFAYTPHFWKAIFGEDATVFRGGFSISYEPAFYNILLNVYSGAPFAASLVYPSSALASTVTSPAPLPFNPRGPVVRQLLAGGLGSLNPQYLSQTRVSDDFHAPYSEQWSFGVQHRFGKKQIFEARYVGNHGVGLFQSINDNFFAAPLLNGFTSAFNGVTYPAFPTALPAGSVAQVCTDIVATTFVREDACNGRLKRFSSITTRDNGGFSSYHGLQTQYNGHFFNDSLTVGATYTFSKTIDNASEIFATQGTSPNAQNPFCLNTCERALSGIDRPHASSFNFIWDIPFYKEQHGFVGHVLGGWQLNGFYVLTSGQLYTPQSNYGAGVGVGQAYLTAGERAFITNPNADPRLVGINNQDANVFFGAPMTADKTVLYSVNDLNKGIVTVVTPSQVKYVINGPGAAAWNFQTPYGNAPRNSERGPITNQLNLSLFKNTQITERVRLQLRLEAFNALNHPNPGFGVGGGGSLPDNSLLDAGFPGSSFGENRNISYARRVVQLGLRITF